MRKGTRTTMKAKAKPFRTLLVLPVVVLAALAVAMAAVALFGLGLRTAEIQTTPASKTTYYNVQDLGTLGDTYRSSRATGVNDSGQVVGKSLTNDGYDHAFLYDSIDSTTQQIKDLGTFGALRAMPTTSMTLDR